MRADDSHVHDTRPVVVALLATVVLHLMLGAWLSSPLTFALRLPVAPTKLVVTSLPVNPAKLPPSLRLAETSSQGNREAPVTAPYTAARNQVAAQPIP